MDLQKHWWIEPVAYLINALVALYVVVDFANKFN